MQHPLVNQKHFVSVLMTAYNRERFVGAAIESVLNSTYQNFELLILDDCSTDDTIKIVNQYEKVDQRIVLIRNTTNLGDYPNRNRAIKFAKGEYIFFVDSDDQIFPKTIEKTVEFFNTNPDLNFGVGTVGKHLFDELPEVLTANKAITRHFFQSPILAVGPGGTVSKRDYHNLIGNYPVKYGPANDMYFNLKAVSQDKVVVFPFEFVNYRRHEGQEINNKFSYLVNGYLYLKDALKELTFPLSERQINWIDKKNKRRFTVNITKYFFRTFNIPKTIKAIRLAGFGFKDAIQGIFH